MSDEEQQQVELSDEDIEFLVAHLRSATEPVTTQDLVDAIRNQSS